MATTLTAHHKNLLIGMKAHIAKDRDMINEILLLKPDADTAEKLRDVHSTLTDAMGELTALANNTHKEAKPF